MTQSILDFIRSSFISIYTLGSSTYLYNDNGIQISLNDFLLALAIMTIVLAALINTVRYRIGLGIEYTGHTIDHIHKSSKPSKMLVTVEHNPYKKT